MSKKNVKSIEESEERVTIGEISITHHNPNSLFLREAWASGKHQGEAFDVTRNANASAIHFEYRGRFYSITLESIVGAFLTAATGEKGGAE